MLDNPPTELDESQQDDAHSLANWITYGAITLSVTGSLGFVLDELTLLMYGLILLVSLLLFFIAVWIRLTIYALTD